LQALSRAQRPWLLAALAGVGLLIADAPASRASDAESGGPGRVDASDATAPSEQSLVVTATAYNSLPGQTSGNPQIAAWGDRLEPGMKAIAVSRDLLEMGLTRGTRVRIDGLPGEYRVLDKMNKRWKRKIDVYMGHDVDAARRFGRRRVRISWAAPPDVALAGREPPAHMRAPARDEAR